MKIFYSNRIEVLLESFKKEAFDGSNPFTYRHVITPTLPIEEWMKIQLAFDPQAGIGAGLNFSFLNPALQMLRERFIPEASPFPSLLDIKLAIEHKIIEIIHHFDKLPEREYHCWKPLFNYIKGKEGLLPQKLSKRFLPLSERLAALFVQYGIYGRKMVSKWSEEPFSHWQIELWNSLFGKGNRLGWSPFFNLLEELKVRSLKIKKTDFQIHIFAFSHLSKAHFEFLKELSSFISVSIYHLSFCLAFWGDLSSDKDNRRLLRTLHSKQINEAVKEDFFSYLHNRHRFLANTGTVGKKQSQLYEDSGVEIFENYLSPFQMSNHPLYSDVGYPELYESRLKPPQEWLPYFQLDLLLLKNPEKDEISLFEKDASIEFHAFSSLYQEVLNLYHRIARAIDQSSGALTPKDFLVMAPDITVYSAYIKAVFGEKNSLISYHILDEKKAQNRYLEAFNLLLEIEKNRWSVSAVLKLFTNPLFQHLNKFNDDDLEQIGHWIEQKGISWGYDLTSQKEEIEKKDPSKQPISENLLGHCSWKEQLEELVKTLSHFPTIEDSFPSLTFTQTDLLGRFYLLISKINHDVKQLNDGSIKSVACWTKVLKQIVETYFGLEDSSFNEFNKNLEEVLQSSQRVNLDNTTFTQFYFHFESLFSKENNRLYSKSLQSVIFCSLLPMRAIPAQWIFMMGMNHDQFPRQEELNDLNLLKKIGPSDYLPSKKDFDRSLFLEAVLSARKGLSVSFISKSLSLKQREPPSSLVEEFLSFINRSYFKKSPVEIYFHPLFSYDPAYFDHNSPFINYSEDDYRLSRLLVYPEKKTLKPFFKPYELSSFDSLTIPKGTLQIDLKDLLQCAKSPLKHYFQKKLECFFNEGAKVTMDEERFSLNALEHYQVKNFQFKNREDNFVKLFNLPKGLFIDIAKNRVKNDFSRLSSHLNEYQLNLNDLFSLELHAGIKAPEWTKDGKRLRFPALEIALDAQTSIRIVGVIEKCTAKGILIESDWCVKAGYQYWPLFLILSVLKNQHKITSSEMIFIKKKSQVKQALSHDDSIDRECLKGYLRYYFFVLNNPSPLFPEWCEAIETRDLDTLQQSIKESMDDPSHSELLKSCLSSSETELSSIVDWSPLHSRIYGQSFKAWLGHL